LLHAARRNGGRLRPPAGCSRGRPDRQTSCTCAPVIRGRRILDRPSALVCSRFPRVTPNRRASCVGLGSVTRETRAKGGTPSGFIQFFADPECLAKWVRPRFRPLQTWFQNNLSGNPGAGPVRPRRGCLTVAVRVHPSRFYSGEWFKSWVSNLASSLT
jgi:hypothetical protein